MKNLLALLNLFAYLVAGQIFGSVPLDTTFSVNSTWDTGYTSTITVTNNSQTSVSSWEADFDLPSGQTLNSLWNGQYTLSNQHVKVLNSSWNGALQPQESVSIGFQVDNPGNASAGISNLTAIGDSSGSTTSTQPQFSLNTSISIDSNWQTGYQVTVTLINNTSSPSASWAATFLLPPGQSISSLWNASYTISGQTVNVINPTWVGGGVIPAGSTASFGFVVSNPQATTPGILNLVALADGSSTPSGSVPAAPTLNPITLSSNSQNSYTVSWNSVANATSYLLQQDTTSSFTNPVNVVNGAVLFNAFQNQPNGTYYYRVAAQNPAGQSSYSNTESVTINVVPLTLSAPVLNAINNSTGLANYQVSWGSVPNAQGYTLQESTASDFSTFNAIFSGTATSYELTGKSPGTYYYRATAFAGSITSTPSNIESVTVTQQPVQSSAVVEGYWESWNSTDSLATIVQMSANVIDIAFANFTTTGLHTFTIAGLDCDNATLTSLISQAHNLGKQVKISIGGATYPISPQLVTTQDAQGMAQAIAQFVQQFSLDGVDFDIEDYPAADLQIALLQNTRQLLGSTKLISYTPKSPASTTAPYYQVIQGAYPYLSYISIMCYDYAPGYSYQTDIQNLIGMGVPASKIIIGLMPGYDDLNVLTSLTDIANAANYVLSNNLGGVMFWDLNRDHENLTGLGADQATDTAWGILQ